MVQPLSYMGLYGLAVWCVYTVSVFGVMWCGVLSYGVLYSNVLWCVVVYVIGVVCLYCYVVSCAG